MLRGLLASRQELTQLRDRVGRHPFDVIYETLRKRCAMVLESRPISETEWRAQHAQGRWAAALHAAQTCQGRIFDLIISHHIDPNTAYRDRAVEEMKSLAAWSTWTDPCHNALPADLCTGECCATMAVALDWLEEDLAEPDRLRCLHALKEKGLSPYVAAVQTDAWWYTCYHNWNTVVNAGVGLAALALSEDDPAAAAALALARKGLEHFFQALGREGGWDEGISYWAYALRYLLLLGEALDRKRDDRGIFRQRGMDNTASFGVFFSPHGQSASFGDLSAVPLYGVLYALSKRYGNKDVCWWLDRYGFRRDVSTTGWSDAGLSLLLRPTDIEPEPTPELPAVKVFNEIGWAAVADRWPEPSLYVAVKTGDLSANHSQLDMNAIQVQVDGEMLLADLGSPPFSARYFSADRFKFYEAQARAHNTLIVGGRDHAIDAQGQIVEAEEEDAYRWVAANAGSALGASVRFNRHVILLLDGQSRQGQTLVVVDEVSSTPAEKVEAFWHTFGQLELDGQRGLIRGRRAELRFGVGASTAVACSAASHPVGKFTDNALLITAPRASRLVLATVFSRKAVGEVQVRQTSRGDVTVKAAGAKLHFKGSRRHLALDSVQPA